MAKEPRTKLVEPKKAGPYLSRMASEVSSKRTQPFRDLYNKINPK